jgi:WD40 repeat protein
MISGSADATARQWDLKEGQEIEEAQDVCKGEVQAVALSRDSRWVVTGGGVYWEDVVDPAELKVCEVETGIVKTLSKGHSELALITCIDISADNTRLASGSDDSIYNSADMEHGQRQTRGWSIQEQRCNYVGAVRFSTDSKKLALRSWTGTCLEVWDVQSQKLDVRIGDKSEFAGFQSAPTFWTNKNKNILAALIQLQEVTSSPRMMTPGQSTSLTH